MTDLWPTDISTTLNIKLPVEILQEQADLLGVKTKNLVKAIVATIVKDDSFDDLDTNEPLDYLHRDENNNSEAIKLAYSFVIVAPTLGNYHYSLFSIVYDLELFPVQFNLDEELQRQINRNPVVNSEEELVELLGKILNAPKTKRIIQSLLTHSRSRSEAYFRKQGKVSVSNGEAVY